MTESNPRHTYEEIKIRALLAYYDFCRSGAVARGKPHWNVLGSVIYEFECFFQREIEELMFQVVLFVLAGNWSPEVSVPAKKYIEEQLSASNLDELLSGIPSDESEEFRRDLEILRLCQTSSALQSSQEVL